MSGQAVFAYGSLVSSASAAETLGRDLVELRPAILHGWRRRFSLVRDNRRCEKTFARDSDGSIPDLVLGLNIEPAFDPGGWANGALIATTSAELQRLDRRELRYDRVDVTESVTAEGNLDVRAPTQVFTYVAKPENSAAETPKEAVILASYIDAVERAFDALGPGQLDAYRASTDLPAVERIEAHLVAANIPEGNPRGW